MAKIVARTLNPFIYGSGLKAVIHEKMAKNSGRCFTGCWSMQRRFNGYFLGFVESAAGGASSFALFMMYVIASSISLDG